MLEYLWWLFILLSSGLLFVLGYPLLELLFWRQLWLRQLARQPKQNRNDAGWSSALLYLSGISHFASVALLPQQVDLVEQVAAVLQPERRLTLAFPYEATTAETFRRFELWPRLGLASAPLLICSARNFWQAWLASWFPDWYGAPVARCLAQRLGPAAAPHALVVIGNSAGGAILLSAAPHLRQIWPTLHITLLVCGGVFGESPGFAEVQAFHQLLGKRDPWVKWAAPVLPRRQPTGAWQQACVARRYQEHIIGDMTHFGEESYYGEQYGAVTGAFMVKLLKEM